MRRLLRFMWSLNRFCPTNWSGSFTCQSQLVESHAFLSFSCFLIIKSIILCHKIDSEIWISLKIVFSFFQEKYVAHCDPVNLHENNISIFCVFFVFKHLRILHFSFYYYYCHFSRLHGVTIHCFEMNLNEWARVLHRQFFIVHEQYYKFND